MKREHKSSIAIAVRQTNVGTVVLSRADGWLDASFLENLIRDPATPRFVPKLKLFDFSEIIKPIFLVILFTFNNYFYFVRTTENWFFIFLISMIYFTCLQSRILVILDIHLYRFQWCQDLKREPGSKSLLIPHWSDKRRIYAISQHNHTGHLFVNCRSVSGNASFVIIRF